MLALCPDRVPTPCECDLGWAISMLRLAVPAADVDALLRCELAAA